MRITVRGLALLSCLVVVSAASSAYASESRQTATPLHRPRTLTLTDVKGDANGINGQGYQDLGSHPGPVQSGGADLLKVAYTSTAKMVRQGQRFVPQCTGFTAAVTLSEAPTADKYYRLTGTGIAGLWSLEYSGGTISTIAYGYGQDTRRTRLITPVMVRDKTFTFTVIGADLLATGERLSSFKIRDNSASSYFYNSALLGATPFEWDETEPHAGTYKPC